MIDGALGHSKGEPAYLPACMCLPPNRLPAGLLMIMTTNAFPRLCRDTKSADALLRPGRVSQTAHVRRTPVPVIGLICAVASDWKAGESAADTVL